MDLVIPIFLVCLVVSAVVTYKYLNGDFTKGRKK